MQRTRDGKSVEMRPTTLFSRVYTLNAILGLVAAVCGFWVAGSRNLLYWAQEMSRWIDGDNGPDIVEIVCETVKLVSRITIGGYGVFKLLKSLA
jgi:hypothetical protein